MSCTFLVNAQDNSYYSFNDMYGQDKSTVYDILEAENGSFWFGTSEGLVHFDGQENKTFVLNDFNTEYTNIKIDSVGDVWFSNFGGQLFKLHDNKIENIIDKFNDSDFISDYIFGKNGKLYFTLNKRSSIFCLGETEPFFHRDSSSIQSIKKSVSGFEFIIYKTIQGQPTFKGMRYEADLSNNTVTQKDSFDIPAFSSKQVVLHHKDSIIGMLANTYLDFFSFKKGDAKNIEFNTKGSLTDNDINGFTMLDNKSVILGKKKSFSVTFNKGKVELSSWSGIKNASKVIKDREGNIWVATLNKGIFIIPNSTMVNYPLIPQNEILKVEQYKSGEFFFSDDVGSLYKYNDQTKEVEVIGEEIITPDFSFSINPYEEQIVFSSQNFIYDLNSKSFHDILNRPYFKDRHFLNENDFVETGIRSFIGSMDGKAKDILDHRYKFKEAQRQPIGFNHYLIKNGKCNNIIESLNKENLYIEYMGGLVHYSKTTSPKNLYHKERPIISTCLLSDPKLGAWVYSNDGFLHKVVEGNIVRSDSIGKDVKQLAYCDSLVFLLSSKSIFRYDLISEELNELNELDGLVDENIVSVFCLDDSLLIWGEKTLQKLPISYNYTNVTRPLVYIKDIHVNDQPLSLDSNKEFEHNQNNIVIHFGANSIRSKQTYTFQYRLLNTSEEWIEITSEVPFARFSYLAPGDYQFQVRVKNEDGAYSNIESFDFVIKSHFTQTWWFISLVIFIVLLIILLVTINRMNTLKKRNALESDKQLLQQEVYKSKVTAIRAQMNPHFMFNALNTIQEFIVTNQSDVASEYLADFADLMRRYLDQSRKEELSLEEEIETMKIYLGLENLRFDNEIKWKIEVDEQINLSSTLIPVMLLQPFVENAIKHGLLHQKGDKNLFIQFSLNHSNHLEIKIQDSGIGRAASQQINQKREDAHTSFATSAIEQRFEMINRSSSQHVKLTYNDLIEKSESKGTEVVLVISIF